LINTESAFSNKLNYIHESDGGFESISALEYESSDRPSTVQSTQFSWSPSLIKEDEIVLDRICSPAAKLLSNKITLVPTLFFFFFFFFVDFSETKTKARRKENKN
jgi:hypothetical protein